MPVFVTIKKSTGETVKSFSLIGAHSIDRVLLWVWRDLFLSLIVSGSKQEKDRIPEMLSDMEDAMSWQSLQRLLYGGRKCE